MSTGLPAYSSIDPMDPPPAYTRTPASTLVFPAPTPVQPRSTFETLRQYLSRILGGIFGAQAQPGEYEMEEMA
ncbi:hypothetical protein B0H17DRAFT_1217333 [Mycena rosella]|uniref:Uncharacterized protein n=1 Tax=Mycena rosella TaxID=1033263 RepID=A0AAD7BYB6_MYCRO|nr:hypothetical protein B0H17DRAFT_1217333 [Mycena rosella]